MIQYVGVRRLQLKIMDVKACFYRTGLTVAVSMYFSLVVLNAGADYGAAKEAAMRGDVPEALALYSEIIADGSLPDKDLARAYYDRGTLFLVRGDFDEAVDDFSRSIKMDSDNVFSFVNRAQVYARQGEMKRAIKDYTRVIKLSPGLASAYYARGKFYQQAGDQGRALKDFEKALELDPEYGDVFYTRAVLYEEQEDVEQALDNYQWALEYDADADDLKARYKALKNRRQGERKQAQNLEREDARKKAEAESLAREEQKDLKHQAVLAQQQAVLDSIPAAKQAAREGQQNDAIDLYTQVINSRLVRGMSLADLYHDRGSILLTTGEFDAAIDDFTKALKIDKKRVFSYTNRARVYEQMGKTKRALKDYSRALKYSRDMPAIWLARGRIYHQQHNHRAALRDYTKAIDVDPDYIEAYLQRGVLFENKGQFEKAMTDYERARAIDPASTDAQVRFDQLQSALILAQADVTPPPVQPVEPEPVQEEPAQPIIQAVSLEVDVEEPEPLVVEDDVDELLTDMLDDAVVPDQKVEVEAVPEVIIQEQPEPLDTPEPTNKPEPVDLVAYADNPNIQDGAPSFFADKPEDVAPMTIQKPVSTPAPVPEPEQDVAITITMTDEDYSEADTIGSNPAIDGREGQNQRSEPKVDLKQILHEKTMQEIAELTQALRQNPREPDLYVKRGNQWIIISETNNAIGDYQQALALNSHYAPAYIARGQVLLQQNRKRRALADFNKAVKIDRNSVDAVFYRAKLF